MATDGRYKLIYYPCGNTFQLFDLETDGKEQKNLLNQPACHEVQEKLTAYMIQHLHGDDLHWVKKGKLCGFDTGKYQAAPDYGLYNQRGLHWPPPNGYQNTGKT